MDRRSFSFPRETMCGRIGWEHGRRFFRSSIGKFREKSRRFHGLDGSFSCAENGVYDPLVFLRMMVQKLFVLDHAR